MSNNKPIKIKLVIEEAKDKDGKVVKLMNPETRKEEVNYKRNDIFGLLGLLRKFDTKIHTMQDWKQSIKLKDKLSNAYVNDLEEIDLSLEEATFLKLYLKEYSEKEGKTSDTPEFELRTLFGVLEQFGE